MAKNKGQQRGGGGLWRLIGFALLVAALYKEFSKPKVLRTGYGEVAGFVPYDFRRPSVNRLVRSFWAPDEERLFTPMAFGVGWAINFGWIARRLGGRK